MIEGEIVPKQAKTHIHELIKSGLNLRLARSLPEHLWLGIETTVYLSPNTFVEPDLLVYPRYMQLESVKGPDIIVAIEVALTSLAYDRGLKARIYARYGVKEMWVIDAKRRRTYIHRDPSGDGWSSITEHGTDFELTIAALPGFSQRLDQI